MNERERIGKRIAELRKKRGYSQVKLGELAGVGPAHLARVELGQYSVGIDILTKIADALGCQIDFVEK